MSADNINLDDYLPLGGTQRIEGYIRDDLEGLHGYRIEINESQINIHLVGHGSLGLPPWRTGAEIVVEVHGGIGKVYVYSDINQDEATHIIDMDDALEENHEDA